MIFLYTFTLLLLGAVRALVVQRAAWLARKHGKAAARAAKLLSESLYKPGNSNKPHNDQLAQNAKRQYELGGLIALRDRLEAKYLTWQHRADRLTRLQARVHGWKGKKLPYTMGALDVWLALYLVDRCGAAEYVNPYQAIEAVARWLGW